MKQRLQQRLSQASLSLILMCALFNGAAEAVPLVDGPSDSIRAGRVQLALESYDILSVYPDKTFQGERAFTRYELAQALSRAENYLKKRYQLDLKLEPRMLAALQIYLKPNGDIPGRHWAKSAVLQTLATGMLSGDDNLRFYGHLKVSRYQLAKSLAQLFEWLQIEPQRMQSASIRDLPQQHWGRDAVQKMVEANILSLDNNQRFQGEQTASRYDLAEGLVKALQQVDLVAQQRPLVVKEVVPLPTELLKPRYDGRREPVYYRSAQ